MATHKMDCIWFRVFCWDDLELVRYGWMDQPLAIPYYLLFAYCTLSFHSSIFLEYLVLLAFYLGSSLGFSKLSDGLVKPASQAWPMEVLLSIGKDIQSRNDNSVFLMAADN